MTSDPRQSELEIAVRRVVAAAEDIVAGRLRPIDGARLIEAVFADWLELYQAGNELIDAMAVFAARSDEWEELFDNVDRRAAIESSIVEEAIAYLELFREKSQQTSA